MEVFDWESVNDVGLGGLRFFGRLVGFSFVFFLSFFLFRGFVASFFFGFVFLSFKGEFVFFFFLITIWWGR